MKLTEREKAYHDGYEQGRFDEYAERMGYDQAEKAKAKIDKQKNCPYCHEDNDGVIKSIVDDGLLCLFLLKIRKSGREVYAFAFGNNGEITGADYDDELPRFCPMCGRPLNEEEGINETRR